MKLIIHPELSQLLPPLSPEEYVGLETDILKNGCLTAIVTWNDTVVDGHNRYEICEKHDIPFDIKALEFESLNDAKFWAWSHQSNRRNLIAFQRVETALQFKSTLVTKAKERMSAGGRKKGKQVSKEGMTNESALEDETIPTTVRAELAKIAGASEGTVSKVEYLLEHADEAVKQKLRCGDATIHHEYITLLKFHNRERVVDASKLVSVAKEVKPEVMKPEVTTSATLYPLPPDDVLLRGYENKRLPLSIVPTKDTVEVIAKSLYVHVGPEYLEQITLPSMDYLYQTKGKDGMAAYLISLIQRYELGKEIKKAEF